MIKILYHNISISMLISIIPIISIILKLVRCLKRESKQFKIQKLATKVHKKESLNLTLVFAKEHRNPYILERMEYMNTMNV